VNEQETAVAHYFAMLASAGFTVHREDSYVHLPGGTGPVRVASIFGIRGNYSKVVMIMPDGSIW
jgi:hypothetical protein